MPKPKPEKPYPDFPLFPHSSGQWAKKILNKTVYFGAWADPTAALNRFLDERDDLYAGREPRLRSEGFTLRDLANEFLTVKTRQLESRELSERSFVDYNRTTDLLTEFFGKDRLLSQFGPAEFSKYREHLAKKRGPVALGNEIGRVRVVFNFAYDHEFIPSPIRYGKGFRKPSRKVLRESRHGKPKRMFSATEIRQLIICSYLSTRAMILMGINCGMGQSELSEMPKSAVDLERGWLNYPRPKTAVPRRCPLWPETIAVLKQYAAKRPKPKNPEDDHLFFVTKYGNRFVKRSSNKKAAIDPIALDVRRLARVLKFQRNGVNFYALRHTVETIGGECKDQVAVDAIMGHAREDMASLYREGISDERLKAVTDTVYNWLWSVK